MDGIYLTKPEFYWGKFLFKACLILILLPFAVMFAIVFWLLSLLTGRSDRTPGILSNLVSQVTGYWLTAKLFKKDDVPVRDIRVRDHYGEEHHVQIRGHFLSGNVNVGDDVTVEGADRGGTLMFRRGINHRTNSEIRVQVQ